MRQKESRPLAGHENGGARRPATTSPKNSTLVAAAALQRAACAHIAEELAERRTTGHLPTLELCRLLPLACWLHDELAAVAAQEGEQP